MHKIILQYVTTKVEVWKKNIKEAVKLWRLAADQGYAPAQYNLGNCFEKGRGVKRDFKEAVRLYRLAAAQNNTDAQYDLAFCYEKGRGVKKDINEARYLYQLLVQQGHEEALKRLKRLKS